MKNKDIHILQQKKLQTNNLCATKSKNTGMHSTSPQRVLLVWCLGVRWSIISSHHPLHVQRNAVDPWDGCNRKGLELCPALFRSMQTATRTEKT